jgi:ABC-type cobalamin/Fe3+-siderophores transport system ATPase subunit
MSFELAIPKTNGDFLRLTVNLGDQLFVLGANGTGKSSLMHRLYGLHWMNARYVSAHRQNWLESSEITLSSRQRRQAGTNMMNADSQPYARWRDDFSSERAGIALYDLVDAENARARAIAEAVDTKDLNRAAKLSAQSAPLAQINDLLAAANVPIQIVIRAGEDIRALRAGGIEYGVTELSDGERNALLVATNVLTAKPGTLILVDEPERHLHRSIISPLLTHLFAARDDCAFVVSTHDVMLPMDNPSARTLLTRSCAYVSSAAANWDLDILSPGADIDEEIRRDILGSRRTILFVEGINQSLDKPLYALIFPTVSVVAKQSCRDVEHAVAGLRSASDLHWINTFGVVDNDGRSEADVARLAALGVFALPTFSVEAIYYHPSLQRVVAERRATLVGGDVGQSLAAAAEGLLDAVSEHADRLSARVAEKTVREVLFANMPRQADILARKPIVVTVDVAAIVASEEQRLRHAIQTRDLPLIIGRYPVRETPALHTIARCLGFQNRTQYEAAVLKLLADDPSARSTARFLFGPLEAAVNVDR